MRASRDVGRRWDAPAAGPAPGRRFGWRVWFLPMFLWPLMLDIPIELMKREPENLVGNLLGLFLAWRAARLLAEGRAGANRRGAILMGVAAGLVAHLSAEMHGVASVLIGFGAFLGTRLLTEDLQEAPPEPKPEPAAPPREDPLAAPRATLERIHALAPGLPHAPLLLDAASAMGRVLDDLTERPARLPEARRHLTMQLDGLARIVDRLEAGAVPPQSLPDLLAELRGSAERLRAQLNNAESEALDIQVKVLAQRLKEEGP